MRKNVKHCFDQMNSSAEVITCKGHAAHSGQKHFTMGGIWVAKEAEFHVDLKNIRTYGEDSTQT
jgi:hypothetical protein